MTTSRQALATRDADDPPLAGNTPNGRFYRLVPDGPLIYPSITNVKGVKNSEALNGWKVKMTANKAGEWIEWLAGLAHREPEKALAALAKLTESPWGVKDWLRTVKRAHQVRSDERALRGSKVHLAVEQILTGQEVTVDAAMAPVAAFQQFAENFQLVPVEVEVTVVNHTFRYAGTGDLLARVGGAEGPLAIIDWKSRDSLFEETALQLAALAHAEFILRPDGSQETLPRPEVAIGVALGDDGRYHAHQMDISERSFAQFCGARALFDFDPAAARGPAITSPSALRDVSSTVRAA